MDQLQANGGAQTNGQGGQQAITNGGGAGGASDLAGVSISARKVLQALRATPQTNEGLHAQVIAQNTGLELTEVNKAGDELMGLGKIYTTVDDLTWAILDM